MGKARKPNIGSELIEAPNQFYLNLLGYSPKQTSLQNLSESQWKKFTLSTGFNPNSSGIYLPRNQTAVIREQNILSLFHEYFGHGLYSEQSLSGRRLVDLEEKLLEKEKQEFREKKFTLEDIQKFRKQNKIFQELDEFRKQNLLQYETFAIWTEYLLSGKFGLKEDFEKKYDSLRGVEKKSVDSVIKFNEQYGNLATFYAQGLAKNITTERVRRLLGDVWGNELINNSKLVLLTGSKKPFSDIDLFVSSNYLQTTKNNWLDLVVFNEEDFEKKIKFFESQVTHPIMSGEFVAGDEKYLQQKKEQLQEQPITEEAIQHNFCKSEEQRTRALEYPKKSKERKLGFNYSETYLRNALALREGLRLFTKEDLFSWSLREKRIQLKGGRKI
jgi:hypothetical protein